MIQLPKSPLPCVLVTTAFLALFGNVAFVPSALADKYDEFHTFAQSAFGAERDSLVYEWFGQSLRQPQDWWTHTSEESAAVGFSTNLPAQTYVEYGPTTGYGSVTTATDRAYYVHLHYLTGLSSGVVYHYRTVTEDERGNIVRSADRTLTPAIIPDAIRIPDDMTGPPFILDAPGAYYIVTADIQAPRTAFELAASGVTLDLGGNTVTYNNEFQVISGDWPVYRDQSGFGVRTIGADNFRVCNGTIRQGVAQNSAHPSVSIGFNPIFADVLHLSKLTEQLLSMVVTKWLGCTRTFPAEPTRFTTTSSSIEVGRSRIDMEWAVNRSV